jgi:hypothetical protein
VCTAWAMVATYRDLSDIERRVATVGLQRNLATLIHPLPDVCEPSGGYRVFADDLDVLWAKPTTGRRKEWSEVLNHLRVTPRDGHTVQIWGR